MIQENFKILVLTLIFVAMRTSALQGFEVQTHTKLSERATDASRLNDFLTTVLQFEFPQGTGQEVGEGEFKTVRQLISDVGAVDEDNPFTRTRAHFHDPTKAWAQAGLGQVFESSILWSQNPNQVLGGKHSWQDARNSYFNALTSTDSTQRKKYYAETFETLGHLIHLVQDAATPAHTRNDAHVGFFVGQGYGFPIGDPDRFHQWAKVKGVGAINAAGSLPFDPSILNQTYNDLVPIAGIIDTTTTAGPATPSAATNIGIAEYSNANFFSDDTILRDYAFPNITQMELSQEAGPDGPELRSYLRKSFAPGPTGYRAAVSTSLIDKLPVDFPTQQLELDDNVMADYGALLFPRAIGYSAGLIDYFFRGSISCGGLYTSPDFPNPSGYLVRVNEMLGYGIPEPAGQGEVRLVITYTINGQPFATSSPSVQVDLSTLPRDIDTGFDYNTLPLNAQVTSGPC